MLRALLVVALGSLATASLACGGSSAGTLGAVVGVDNETGAVHVRDVRDGAAADKAGLLAGDEILMIDGVYVRDLGVPAVKRKLAGEAGTSIDLTVVRGDRVLRVKLTREPMTTAPAPTPPPREERLAP